MNIQTLKEELKKTTRLSQLQLIFQAFLAQYQITHYAFTYYSRHVNSHNKIKYSYASKPYKSWHDHYLSERYEDVDSTMTTVYRSAIPIHWDLQQQLTEAKTERERQMRLDSIQYGAEKGVSIPIHGPFEDFASFVLVQMKGETFLNHWQNVQHEILAAAYFYYEEIKRLLLENHQGDETYDLSPHQIQCLLLTAKQYSVAEIGKKLGITERTVNFHLQKTNKKLGTKNKHQSVAKAIEKGILQI